MLYKRNANYNKIIFVLRTWQTFKVFISAILVKLAKYTFSDFAIELVQPVESF